jgi:hypothetical protein
MKKHDEAGKCPCARCQAIASGLTPEEADAQQREWENRCLVDRGFYVHFVGQDETSPTGFNAHTHGLDQFDHLDFQIVIPLPPEIGHGVLTILAERVKEGEKFEANQLVEKVLTGGVNVKLVEAKEDDRKVFRVILPDPKGRVEPDEINQQYATQYADIEGVTIKKRPEPPWIPYKVRKNRG